MLHINLLMIVRSRKKEDFHEGSFVRFTFSYIHFNNPFMLNGVIMINAISAFELKLKT